MADNLKYTDDISLLKRFEPVLRFNRGERFFPMHVDRYVRECSLWQQDKGSPPQRLVPEGELDLDRLVTGHTYSFDTVHFLQFIEPLNVAELARISLANIGKKQDKRDIFHAGRGRLARVGYGSRLVDALFSLTLLARGRVPGDTAAAAIKTYRQITGDTPQYTYFGRVVRDNGWIALQYWFFYPYNNWRSGFFGVNDHEADWEQICVYVYENDEDEIRPAWVAYASHDFSGDDLRRRWDDPEVHKIGEHPIVYVGAGSHASYFERGEYLAEFELPFLSPLVKLADRFNRARAYALAEYQEMNLAHSAAPSEINLFRIPFVDYARGDGHIIGPGQDREWSEPVLLDPVPGWVLNYRGLWGLYARDPLSGEDAPAGPKFNRDGSVRKAWYDPVGWAGLDKVPQPHRMLDAVYEQRAAIISRQRDLTASIRDMTSELLGLGVEVEAMRGHTHLKEVYDHHNDRIKTLAKNLDEARSTLTEDNALLVALDRQAELVQSGDKGPLRAHISRAHHPMTNENLNLSRIAELWAAASTGLMLLAFVALAIFEPESLWLGFGSLITLYLFIEAAFRRTLGRLITGVTLLLSAASAVILLIEFFWPIMITITIITGGYLLWENLRELFA